MFSHIKVLQNILETERSYAKELQILISTYLRPLQSYDKWVNISLSWKNPRDGHCWFLLKNAKCLAVMLNLLLQYFRITNILMFLWPAWSANFCLIQRLKVLKLISQAIWYFQKVFGYGSTEFLSREKVLYIWFYKDWTPTKCFFFFLLISACGHIGDVLSLPIPVISVQKMGVVTVSERPALRKKTLSTFLIFSLLKISLFCLCLHRRDFLPLLSWQ